MQSHAGTSYGQKNGQEVHFIHEYSEIFEKSMKFLNFLTSSIILLGQNKHTYASKKFQKIHGIQPNHTILQKLYAIVGTRVRNRDFCSR